MIYPSTFEAKIGFTTIREQLAESCMSPLGQEKVAEMQMMDDAVEVNEKLLRVVELKQLLSECPDFPLTDFFDMRRSVSRLRLHNTHLDEEELYHLKRSLYTIHAIKRVLVPETFALGDVVKYPSLQILAEQVSTFPHLIHQIDTLLDKEGHLRDDASPELLRLRQALAAAKGSISKTVYAILHRVQQEGLVDKDTTPVLRDDRLVIPIPAASKRRVPGIVHEVSATGKTAFVEPAEVVEINNRVRELEADERKEVVRILTTIADMIRPDVQYIVASYSLLAHIDFLHAKLVLAERYQAVVPQVVDTQQIDLVQARHPLLQETLHKNNRRIVPLDISLTDGRILIISGPNAGGKSVCLKTMALLQYMLQCGLPIPVSEQSRAGIFTDILLDLGDEQSIENDLSTYSSHLRNMKVMLRMASPTTLILIDEFGTGTEPQLGGAIAEAILTRLWQQGTYAVITTHYQNLKHFADEHKGVINGAMLYDRQALQPLFQLLIGRPGASFAIEIARKIGIPEEVILHASDLVGQDYIQADKYLQDIARDKRYWAEKREKIHQQEKTVEKTIDQYESSIASIDQQRKEILRRAKEQAEELLKEANRRIENTIREIREQQAEKEAVKRLRKDIDDFKGDVQTFDSTSSDEAIDKKIEQIKARKERQEKRKHDKEKKLAQDAATAEALRLAAEKAKQPITIGDKVSIKGAQAIGTVETITGSKATVIFGTMRTKMPIERLQKASTAAIEQEQKKSDTKKFANLNDVYVSRDTRNTIDEHSKGFQQQLNVIGMRAEEALNAVTSYIDDAILLGLKEVRILHGKGNGVLRQVIRNYLSTVRSVTNYHDEHTDFGGTGITVVNL